MSWFRRHFDTMLMLILIAFLLVWFTLSVIGDSNISSNVTSTILVILLIMLFIGAGWQLRKKIEVWPGL